MDGGRSPKGGNGRRATGARIAAAAVVAGALAAGGGGTAEAGSDIATRRAAGAPPAWRVPEGDFAAAAAANDTFRFAPRSYRRSGIIRLGQADLTDVWNCCTFSVQFPRERKGWAIAVAHAAQLFRNVTGVDDRYVDGNHYVATGIQESSLGADPASARFTYRFAAPYPINYHPAADGDGFFQVVESTAFAELQILFPARFAGRSHAELVAGNRFETSALTQAYYNVFAWQFFVGSGWRPGAFVDGARDPQALARLLAYGYNRGVWNDVVSGIFTDRRDVCGRLPSMADAAGACFPAGTEEGAIYVRNVPRYGRDLVAASRRSARTYPGGFDTTIRQVDVDRYLTAIAPMYSAAEIKRARKAARTAFRRAAEGRKAIGFRAEFGPVLDAIVLALPADTATGTLCAVYARCATE